MKFASIYLVFILFSGLTAQHPLMSYNFDGTLQDQEGASDLQEVGSNVLSFEEEGGRAYIDFNSSGYLKIESPSLSLQDEFTVSFWMRTHDIQRDQKIIGQSNSALTRGFVIGVDKGVIKAELFGAQKTVVKSSIIPSGTWVNVAVRLYKGRLSILLSNTNKIASSPASNYMFANEEDIVIGVAPWDNDSFNYDGDIDELKIFSNAISVGTVRNMVPNNGGTCTFERKFFLEELKYITTPNENPKPTWIDIDVDGDKDLLTGDKEGRLYLFESENGFLFNRDRYNPLVDINIPYATPVTADVNGDNIDDLLIGGEDGRIRYFDNCLGDLREVIGMQNPFNGIDAGSRSFPCIGNIDEDESPELLVGNEAGQIKYYKLINGAYVEQTGATNPFSMITTSGYSQPVLFDLDGDTDMDLLVSSNTMGVQFFINENGQFADQGNSHAFTILNQRLAPAVDIADMDGDGDVDLIFGVLGGLLFHYENIAGQFEQFADEDPVPFHAVDIGDHSTPTIVDIDIDGDNDVVVGDKSGKVNFFLNEEGIFDQKVGPENPFNNIDVGNYSHPAFSDLSSMVDTGSVIIVNGGLETQYHYITNGDFDTDLILGSEDGKIRQYTVNEDGAFEEVPEVGNIFKDIDVGSHSSPSAIYNKQDLYGRQKDLVIGSHGSDSGLNYFEKDHYTTSHEEVAFYFSNSHFDDMSDLKPYMMHTAIDPFPDAIVGSAEGKIKFVKNLGVSSTTVDIDIAFDVNDVGRHSSPAIGDLDGDGDWEAIVGTATGKMIYFEANQSCPLEQCRYQEDKSIEGYLPSLSFLPDDPTDILFLDYDRDGDQDIYYLEHDLNNNSAQLMYRVHLGGSYSEANWAGLDLGNSASLSSVDYNKDGYIDFLASEYLENNSFRIRVFLYTPESRGFAEETSIIIDDWAVFPRASFDLFDIEQDGDWDVIIGSSNLAEVFVNNNGDYTYDKDLSCSLWRNYYSCIEDGEEYIGPLFNPAEKIIAEDVLGDEREELLIVDGFGKINLFAFDSQNVLRRFGWHHIFIDIDVIASSGDLYFLEGTVTNELPHVELVFVDVDGDGIKELISYHRYRKLRYFGGNGGCLRAEADIPCGTNIWKGPSTSHWHASGANWSLGRIPKECDNVILPSDYKVQVLPFNKAVGQTIEVRNNGKFTVHDKAQVEYR